MSEQARSVRWRAWSGLVLAPAAWVVHHQLVSDLNYADCRTGNGPLAIAVGLGALAVAIIGGLLSAAGWRAAKVDPVGRFISQLGVASAVLFGLTLLFQIMAASILPSCFK